jgi:uncharacterized protein
MGFRRCLAFALLFLLGSVSVRAGDDKLRALVLSGMNNHDWRSTTPLLKHLLVESGRFTVSILDDPSQCNEKLLQGFDVIISNWTDFPAKDRIWGSRAENTIMDFVRSGKGFVLFHAASACFPTWPEYQQLIGATWGEKTGHGPYHAFNVSVLDTVHPVTRVIGNFATEDELWHRMDRRPEVHILCTAYSDTMGGGTGQQEPVAYSTEFGRGRGFYLVLGHDARAMLNPSWAMLLLRGAEWAATGHATIDLPFDIPLALHRIVSSADTSELDLRVGVHQLVQSSSRNISLRRALAKGMAGMLTTNTPITWKKFFCEQLSLIGTAEDVPALARLLDDSSLSFASRFALERIPNSTSTEAIRSSASSAAGLPLIGLTNTIGEKKDSKALDLLKKKTVGDDNNALKGAAIHALGKIGGPEAVRLLKDCSTDSSHELSLLRAESLLRCAETYESAGELYDGAALYESLTAPQEAPHIRGAGLAGLVRCQPDKAAGLVLGTMKSRDETLQAGITRVLRESTDQRLAGIVVENIAGVPPDLRARILSALADCGESSALPEMYKALSSPDRTLRAAGLYGIGRLGDSSSVDHLCALIGNADASERAEIRKSLIRLQGQGVDERLLAKLKGKSATAVKQEAIVALAARDYRAAIPTLLQMAKNAKPEESKAAIKALGSIADPATSIDLVQMLKNDRYAGQRAALAKALVNMGTRDQPPERVCNAVLLELPSCPPAAKESMFRVLAEFGGEKSYRAVQSALADPDPVVQTAAIRALSAWPDSSPLEDLFAVAHAPGSSGTRLLAMRGAFTLLEKANGLSENDRLILIERELRGTESSEAKRLLISLLGKQTSVQALRLAVSCLGQPEVVDEAALAVAGIARLTAKDHPRETRTALEKALGSTPSPSVVEQLRPLLVGPESQ